MTDYDFKPKPVAVPKDKPNNQTALQLKFAVDELQGATNKKSPDRAVRLGELLQTGLFELNSAGIAVPKGAVDETAQALSINRCINGRFAHWVRGTSSSFTGFVSRFVADRWISLMGDVTATVNKQALPGASIAEFGRWALRTNVATAAGPSPTALAGQKVEGVDSIIGRIAITAGLSTTVGTRKVGVRLIVNFGTGGSPEVVIELPKVVTVGTSMQRYSWSQELPSLSGKTIGDNSFIWVVFDYVGASYGGALVGQLGVFDLADVTIGAGSSLIAGVPQPAVDAILCRRYYWEVVGRSNQTAMAIGTVFGTGLVSRAMRVYPTPMRISPAIVWSGSIGIQQGGTYSPGASLGTIYSDPLQFEADVLCSANNLIDGRTAILILQPGAKATYDAEL